MREVLFQINSEIEMFFCDDSGAIFGIFGERKTEKNKQERFRERQAQLAGDPSVVRVSHPRFAPTEGKVSQQVTRRKRGFLGLLGATDGYRGS